MSAGIPTARRTVLRWAAPALLIPLATGLGTLAAAPPAALAATGQASQARALPSASSITFTSATSATATYGSAFSFTVTTTGAPAPRLTKSGLLPVGVKFADNADGTATLSGTPRGRSEGVYPLTFYANGDGFARQSFTLTVNRVPGLRHVGTVRAAVGSPVAQMIEANGYPTPSLSESGTLPSGLAFTDNGDGTGDISGTPAVGTGGRYPVTITANSSQGGDSETFNVKVTEAPAFTSAASAAATIGTPFTFTATASGYAAPVITKVGALPKGVHYRAATATFSGTPRPGTAGVYTVTLTARNRSGTVTQTFTLTVS